MNFKILTVNGSDLSGASHEEAAKAFESAAEPITVVLRRNQCGIPDPSRNPPQKSNSASKSSSSSCFCQYYLENSNNLQSPMHSLIMSELIRFQRDRDSAVPLSTAGDCYLDDAEYSCIESSHIRLEEVNLIRPKENQKLGLTLCDEFDVYNNQVKVVVKHIASGSLAFKSQKIKIGDQILQINGEAVVSMNHAAQMLNIDSTTVTFLIGRPILTNNETSSYHEPGHHDNVSYQETASNECGREASLDMHRRNSSLTEPKIHQSNVSSSGAESCASKRSHNNTGKDSGLGHTLGSSVQSSYEIASKSSSKSDKNSLRSEYNSNSSANEFIYLPSQEQHYQNQASTYSSIESNSHNRIPSTNSDQNNNDIQSLSTAIKNFRLAKNGQECSRVRLSSVEEDENLNDIVSPWVRIARQDYEDKMRQIRTDSDVRNIHPALLSKSFNSVSVKNPEKSIKSLPDTNDNSSSAYSTGESLRSSSSRSPTEGATIDNTDLTKPHVTMTYHFSSDANSDGEGPACYLTHCEDCDSEGFEDASFDFEPVYLGTPFTSSQPVPLPRIRHPPHDPTVFMGHSLSASTRNLWRAAAAVARSRRHTSHTKEEVKSQESNNQDNVETKYDSSVKTSNDGVKPPPSKSHVQFNLPGPNATSEALETCNDPKTRRSSHHDRTRHAKNQQQSPTEVKTSSADDASMEWKVRISRDGTRYITKRPVRERLLRQREKRLLVERSGVTTDDDATDLKLGRHWTRDERKRQLRHAREKKRRREYMQQCRLAVLNENAPSDGQIVELRQRKMSKQKHKRMLLDDFVTVQEIVAHGDRIDGIAKLNPLLSVTFI